jgi:TDG/mug DNA glycosylase family protein
LLWEETNGHAVALRENGEQSPLQHKYVSANGDLTTRTLEPGMNTREYSFHTLPDLLVPALDVVFVGINPSLYSVEHGHYFARPTNRFWTALSLSKLSARARRALDVDVLRPEHDTELPCFGIGFTDVIKRPPANVSTLGSAEFENAVPQLLAKLHRYAPCVACFHGLTGYRPFLRMALRSELLPVLGAQPERVGSTRLYVVPNPSGANAHFTRAEQVMWYDRLADFISEIRKA